ncbi:hypothetical protein [Mesorhizobium amorphae]|uniref:hypothetical protein n=1 Tax=Mesorhizobium amorphae TaxID=71433 RepID=UPI00391F3FEB
MLRTMLSLSALTLGVTLAFSAQATPSREPVAEGSVARKTEGIQVAQNGDYQVFYDGKGNRVIVDPYTGKVIAIQPPQTRFDRRALRLENRERRVERVPDDERYYLDDPEDMARFRRRQMEDRRAYQYPEDDGGFYDNAPADGSMVETFPPAPGPRDRYGDPLPATREGIPAPQPVERQPLKEASIDPAQPRHRMVRLLRPSRRPQANRRSILRCRWARAKTLPHCRCCSTAPALRPVRSTGALAPTWTRRSRPIAKSPAPI